MTRGRLEARAGPHLALASLSAGLAAATGLRPPLILGALGLGLAGTVAVLTGSRLPALCAALLIAGLTWGGARLDAIDRSPLAAEVGRAAPATLVVTGPARRTPFELRIPATVREFARRRVSEPVLLTLPLGRSPPQGAIVEAIVSVRAPKPADGSFDERAYLRRRGVHVVLRAEAVRVVGRRGGLAGLADRLRAHIAATMAPGLRGERRAVVAGIVLGEDEGLTDELADAFRASGLYHLLAVSGQNVGLIVGGVIVIALAAGVSRLVGEAAAILAVLGYLAAVGWQPSVVRAGVAGVLASLAWLASRPSDRWYFLLAGAAVLLLWNPYSALEPGFQLSFAAVAAIFVAVPRLGRRLEGYPVPRRTGDVAVVSVACGLATAPVLLWHFDSVPVYSVLSNLLAAPAVPALLGSGLIAAAVHPVWPGAAAALAVLEGWLAGYLTLVARLVGGLPHAEVGAAAALAVAAVALAGVATVRRRGPRGLLVLAVSTCLAIAAWQLWPSPAWPPPPQPGLRVTALDVGQGDAILLQAPGAAVLVDQGPPEARVASQLRRLGVRRLSLLVLTHPQRDHVGGAASVLRSLAVDAVLDPQIDAPSPEQRDAIAAARNRGVRILPARAGTTIRLGRLVLRLLWPAEAGMRVADPNDAATVLHASYGEVDALLTADAESNVTLRLPLRDAEILKVAHHGSSDERLGDLLDRVRPRVALISAGAGNRYGHPAPSTLATLADEPGVAVYRTDHHGRVSVDTDGTRLWVRTERE